MQTRSQRGGRRGGRGSPSAEPGDAPHQEYLVGKSGGRLRQHKSEPTNGIAGLWIVGVYARR